MQFNCNLCAEQTSEKFGFVGLEDARLMLVLPAPQSENSKAVCMTAYCENVMKAMLSLFDISLESVYITTLVKCLCPFSFERAEHCIDYMRKQFKKVRPEKIICFGEDVAKCLIGKDFSLEQSHGKRITKANVDFTATYDLTKAPDDIEIRLKVLSDLTRFLR